MMNEITRRAIEDVIVSLMDRVMDKVLHLDPFIREEHQAKKPLYAALVPDEIFKGSHFERRFVTPFGKVWEKLAQVVGQNIRGSAILSKQINGNVRQGRLQRIQETLNKLEHRGADGIKQHPNWDEELNYILRGTGELIPTSVICDLYIEDNRQNNRFAFELKAPLPNSDQTKVSKEKLFKLYAMEPCQITDAFYALPYNPYGRREDYNWSFPKRWFDMINDQSVLIGDEFWDFVGGEGTYIEFVQILTNMGERYHRQIYTEYLGLELPENYEYFRLGT